MTHDSERLTDVLHHTCCSTWDREDIAKDKLLRFAQAYVMMADAKYRPQAPGDGMGGIYLSAAELKDRERLYMEAAQYAAQFSKDDDSHDFHIGCSNWETNRATVFAIEAARLLAGADNDTALSLLRLAIKEVTEANSRRRKRGLK
jgi:hypothetical protein